MEYGFVVRPVHRYSSYMVLPQNGNQITSQFMNLFKDLKGRFAEELAVGFFKMIRGFDITKNGVEDRFPDLAAKTSRNILPKSVIEQIRRMPDLLIEQTKDKKPRKGQSYKAAILAEVKFRQGGMISASLLREYAPFQSEDHDLIFLLFDPKGIYCLDIRDIDNATAIRGNGKYRGEYVIFSKCPALSDHPVFHFSDEQKIQAQIFEKMSAQVFGDLLPSNHSPKNEMKQRILNWFSQANASNQNRPDGYRQDKFG